MPLVEREGESEGACAAMLLIKHKMNVNGLVDNQNL